MICTLYVKCGTYLPQFPYNRTLRQLMEPAEWFGKEQQLGTTEPHL